MKMKSLILLLTLFNIKGLAQSMEGEWNGYFRNDIDRTDTKYTLIFSKINDSTYRVESWTYKEFNKNKYDTAICILQGGFSNENILYLEETKAIKSFSSDGETACLQLMKLFYKKRKKFYVLDGDWFTNDNKCGNGSVHLTKSF